MHIASWLFALYALRSLFDKSVDAISAGDKHLDLEDWLDFRSKLDCWTNPEGRWADVGDPRPYTDMLPNAAGLPTRIYDCGPVESRPGLKYSWQPSSSCSPLPKYSLKGLCHAMRGRNLIFIGDSISHHTYETALQFIGKRLTYGKPENHMCTQLYEDLCEPYGIPSFKVYFFDVAKISSMYVVQEELIRLNQDINGVVIANWGAHYDDTVQAEIPNLLYWFKTNLPKVLFIFRASNMAHLDCQEHAVPDNIVREPEGNPNRPNWHWDVFPLQNYFWKEYITDHFPGYVYLDVFNMSSMRPDQHTGDCLHYCVPGPLDDWFKLIYATIKQLEAYSFTCRGSSILSLNFQNDNEQNRNETVVVVSPKEAWALGEGGLESVFSVGSDTSATYYLAIHFDINLLDENQEYYILLKYAKTYIDAGAAHFSICTQYIFTLDTLWSNYQTWHFSKTETKIIHLNKALIAKCREQPMAYLEFEHFYVNERKDPAKSAARTTEQRFSVEAIDICAL